MGQRGKIEQMKIPPAVYACTESAPQIEGSGGIFAMHVCVNCWGYFHGH